MDLQNIYLRLGGVFSVDKKTAEAMILLAANVITGKSVVSNGDQSLLEIRKSLYRRTCSQILSSDNGVISFRSNKKESDVPAGSIALIRINGFISGESDWCNKGLDEYTNEINAAGLNKNIKGVIVQVKSGGGSIEGVDNFSNLIAGFEGKYKKPICAFVDGQADSAAYYIICQAPRIFANGECSEAGSIGTMVTINDYTGYLEMMGIREIIINATKSFNKNADYYNALDGDVTGMQAYLDKYNNIFLQAVEKGRSGVLNIAKMAFSPLVEGQQQIAVPEVFTGKVYVGREMQAIGLVDEISDIQRVVDWISQRAADMGWGVQQGDVVETEDYSEGDWMDEYGYSQNNYTIMFKNLETSILKSTLQTEKTALQTVAQEKGVDSKEYAAKAAKIDAMERELDLRAANIANTELATKIAELEQSLQQSKVENSQELTAKIEGLNAKVSELTASLEQAQNQQTELQANLQAANTEKQVVEQNLQIKQTELEAAQKEIAAYDKFLQKEGYPQAGKKGFLDFAKNDGDQPEGSKQPKRELTQAEKNAQSKWDARKQHEENKKNAQELSEKKGRN